MSVRIDNILYTHEQLEACRQAVLEEYPKAFAKKDNPNFWFIIKKPSIDGINTYYDRIDPSMATTEWASWVRAYNFLYGDE